MEHEFAHFRHIRSAVLPGRSSQTAIEESNYDCPLSRDEILALLSIDQIELELLILNGVLRPSLSLEYHSGHFLEFFTHWDCIAAKISSVLVTHGQSVEVAADLAYEAAPYVVYALIRVPYPAPAELAELNGPLISLVEAFATSAAKTRSTANPDKMLRSLADAVADMEERFRIVFAGEDRHAYSPFAICISSLEA